MTALVAGAPSTAKQNWSRVDWRAVRTAVYRLQVRIAKAVREGRWNKARALQYLLTHSWTAKLWAVKRVISNKGKATPGIDGVIWRSERHRWEAACRLSSKGYKAQPLRRIHIPKSNGKSRPLGIPTMHDRAMQALYALALTPIAETTGDKHAYGFREKRSLHDAIKQSFIALARRLAAPWVLDADIKACFDRIDHDWLLTHIPLPKRILRQWLKSGYLEQAAYHDTLQGTPQGGIISPILANLALDGLEASVLHGHHKKRCRLNVIRYADDFIVTAVTEELLREEIQPAIEAFLAERGLALSPEKTRIRHIDQAFDFLGFTMRKFNGKLITTPGAEKVKRFRTAIKAFLRTTRGLSFADMLTGLNRKLRGFAFANRQVVAKRLHGELDQDIYRWVCRWLRRVHSNKTWAWIQQRYRRHYEGRYNLGTRVSHKDGKAKWTGLFRLGDVPIRRHEKIRAEANPYDPAHREYFKARWVRQNKRRNYDRLFLASTSMEKVLLRAGA